MVAAAPTYAAPVMSAPVVQAAPVRTVAAPIVQQAPVYAAPQVYSAPMADPRMATQIEAMGEAIEQAEDMTTWCELMGDIAKAKKNFLMKQQNLMKHDYDCLNPKPKEEA